MRRACEARHRAVQGARVYDAHVSGGWSDHERGGRFAGFLALGGGLTAILALILAAAAGPPYLEGGGVSFWIVVFAAALLAALVAFPFGIEVALRDRDSDRDRRWEIALVIWGVVAGGLLVAAFAIGFDTGSLAGAAALITGIESALVAATVVVWLLAGG